MQIKRAIYSTLFQSLVLCAAFLTLLMLSSGWVLLFTPSEKALLAARLRPRLVYLMESELWITLTIKFVTAYGAMTAVCEVFIHVRIPIYTFSNILCEYYIHL